MPWILLGKRISQVASDNANNSDLRKCFKSGHCKRYLAYSLVLFVFITIFSLMLHLSHHLNFTGSAVGFKLDSLLKLSDTRARNNKMTLMHYLCKVIA